MKEELMKYKHSDALFERELEENATWFDGSPPVIEYFFKRSYKQFIKDTQSAVKSYEDSSTFWRNVGGDIPRVHSGVPALISKTWTRLIKSNSIEVSVVNGETVDEANTNRLKEILNDNDWVSLLNKGIVTESWAGYFLYKISIDPEVSKYPIIEIVDPRNVEVSVKRKRIVKIEVKTFKKEDGVEYMYVETHKKVLDGYEVNTERYVKEDQKWKKDDTYVQSENDSWFTTYPMALLKNNTTYNSRFPHSPFGESDYTNSQSLFHVLDSVLSNTQLDIDNSKAVKFVSEDITKTLVSDDDTQSVYDKNETVITLAAKIMAEEGFDVKKLIALLQPEVRVEKFNATAKEITGRILANAGLSPVTVGLPGFESVDAAADSQRARKETSIVSRNEKVDRWTEYLPRLFNSVLKTDDDINNRSVGEYDIKVEFDKYGTPSFEDIVDTIVKAKQGGVMSVKQAVEKLYPELSEEEVLQTVLDIKGESLTPFLENEVVE